MSGFDLPSLPGLDLKQIQNMLPGGLGAAGGMVPGAGVQDPERVGVPQIGDRRISGTAGRFEGILADSIAQVQGLQDDVRAKTRGLALGEDVELHDVLIASGKSEVAFNLLIEVRNKLVDAWEKLSRSAV